MNEFIKTMREDGLLRIQIDRSDKKNALNMAMYKALATALREAAAAEDIRVVLLQGTRECFTSGNDLADFASQAGELNVKNPVVKFIHVLKDFPKPVVVAVEGPAYGIGTTLLLHCDLIYAAPSASFCLPFVSLGLCPEFASSLLLPRLVGHAKASEWLMLAEPFSAQEALAAGLINRIDEDPLAAALNSCRTLLKKAPQALINTKELLKRANKEILAETIQGELEVFLKSLQGPEFIEAVTAFFEKREADFSSFPNH